MPANSVLQEFCLQIEAALIKMFGLVYCKRIELRSKYHVSSCFFPSPESTMWLSLSDTAYTENFSYISAAYYKYWLPFSLHKWIIVTCL